MCLYTKNNKPTKLKEDLIVYKVMGKSGPYFISEYKEFQYKPNKTYRTYRLKPLWVKYSYPIQEPTYSIHRGFHAYITLETANKLLNPLTCVIVKCLYPKGTKVFYGARGKDIVGTRIKILGEI